LSARVRPALALGLAVAFAFCGVSAAADAPKTSASSSTFFLRQEGCGATEEAGRLEPKAGTDGATGCGTIGGLPVNEALSQMGTGAADGEVYSTVGKGLPIKLDGARKITGQLAAASWIGEGAGAGSVAFDVLLTGVDAKGKSVNFGETTVTGSITPGENVVLVPFELPVPAAAVGTPIKSLALSVWQHGANVGYSSKQLDGDAYLVMPTKK
jgi:hypothetical protein